MRRSPQQNPADLAKQVAAGRIESPHPAPDRRTDRIPRRHLYPVPGVNPAASEFFEQQSATCWACSTCSARAVALGIFALNVLSSIIMQMASHIVPQLQQLRKEGEQAVASSWYTRYGTVALASFQSIAAASWLQKGYSSQPRSGVPDHGLHHAGYGHGILMWLGEQITERGIGNGISMIILAGIVAACRRRSPERRTRARAK